MITDDDDNSKSPRHALTFRYPLFVFGIPIRRFVLMLLGAFILLFVLYSINWKSLVPAKTSLNLQSGPKKPLKTIFVSLASYRDLFCMRTLQGVFQNAAHPERVFVGVVQQNSDRDPDCLTIENLDDSDNKKGLEKLIKYRSHIRSLKVDYKEAKGPVFARYLVVEKHYKGEDFIFQVDSHTMFAENWDDTLIENIERLPPKSCLSHYPLEFNWKTREKQNIWRSSVPRFCNGFYNNDGILQPSGSIFPIDRKSHEGPFLAAGMTFYPGAAHKEVPMDPYLKHLFHGEELLFGLRMAAHGYKFYSPSYNVCFHFYMRKEFPKSWDTDLRDEDYFTVQRQALHRAKYMMKMIPFEEVENSTYSLSELDKYGINWEDPEQSKNLQTYFTKFGINLKEKKIDDLCSKGLPSSY
ncbi:[Skp1-protein]-hydroxyProline N-acetylglucosaminyltransferase [Acrasis kona]|uniref:[Skp1-protein]-hydroxyProline N-acetylglucosaminyltransferase n=1 Tax=Acrasis kona TaxID=1008807 RepID=A0AAW2ZQ88_9EUKA